MFKCVYIHTCVYTGLNWKALEDWKEFLLLAIPGMFVIGCQWLAFEIGTFITGNIDGVQLAAFTITFNLVSLGSMVHTYVSI